MIDHIGLAVTNLDRSKAFYDAALAPLGIALLMTVPGEVTEADGTALGYGSDDNAYFWIAENGRAGEGTHVALAAASREAVHQFYEAGLAAGGTGNGAPGFRPHYSPTYYAAFVLDPDGINIEAVYGRHG